MSNFWGAINAIRREATKLRTDVYSAGCFTAQEAAMDLDRAASVLEAAGKVDKEDKELAIHWMEDDYSTIRALLAALPEVKT